uniref:SH3 domain-containing protein n=1 Tax=Kwoniella dejecticola CBS 10117 TaxID=1296121 RepID=A0A1A5ZUB3_9TREE|nr:uncharacterized protein I303_08168 [Kwoniella dejecticola CBS 10117]OBR81398.1 hypothetical protein I303_08168 [Kwoniella dejecticola CBS 10117]
MVVRLEEETRKAAKILRSFVDTHNNGLDKVIPRHVLERAAGFAIFTVFKAGFLLSARAGSGVVIARLDDGSWSPPSAIGLGGFGFGGQMGAEVTDFLIVLNSRSAVTSFMSAGNLTLGGNLSVAVGPLGRNAEGSGSVNTKGRIAAMYSYSKTKGLFGGVSVEGSVIVERQDANRLAYGGNPSAKQILSGTFDPPEWAHVLIDQLDKATGLPGGQRWTDRDEDGEGGGMGYGTPERKGGSGGGGGGGYVFGQGVGAGGNTPPATSGRRSRGNSLFGGQNDRSNGNGNVNGSGSPSRPGNSRKGSSFNPFSSGGGGNNSPRRMTLEHSSENYSASPTFETTGGVGFTPTGGRSRSGSMLKNGEVPQPFSYMNPSKAQRSQSPHQSQQPFPREKERDLLGDWDSAAMKNDPFGSTSTNRSASRSDVRKTSGEQKDLLGQWSSDGNALSAQFASMNTNTDTRGRSDSRSKTGNGNGYGNGSEDILENPPTNGNSKGNAGEVEYDYTPRETESKFANMDWSKYNYNGASSSSSSSAAAAGMAKPGNFVSIASAPGNRRSSPTKKQRPFSSYIGGSNSLSNSNSPKPSTSNNDFSPFEDLPVGRLRSNSNEESKPFEQYLHLSSNRVHDMTGMGTGRNEPRPDLKLRSGLEESGRYQGYAKAIGLYDFNTTTQGDLGFKNGQVVVVLDKVDSAGSWWKGYSPISGKEGIFPSNYVEVVELPKNPKGGVGWGELRKRVGGSEFDL